MPLLPNRCKQAPPGAKTIVVIDLGSNSFHMQIVKVAADGQVFPLEQKKQQVQLRAGVNEAGILTREAERRALRCLIGFSRILKAYQIDAASVKGTYTLRRIVKKARFLAKAQRILQHPVEVLSGKEEAALIYRGACSKAPLVGKHIVIDIGGGSTEVILGNGQEVMELTSLGMGCVSFQDEFFPDKQLTEQAFKAAIKKASMKFSRIKQQYTDIGWDHCLGSSGTVVTIRNIVNRRNNSIRYKDLIDLRKRLCRFNWVNRIRLPRLRQDRRDILAGGLAILIAFFEVFSIESLTLSMGGIREGAMQGLIESLNHLEAI